MRRRAPPSGGQHSAHPHGQELQDHPVSEAAGLRWSDVNLFAGQFSLVGKGGKAATLPISEPLAEVLRAWRARYVAGLGAEPLGHPVLVGCYNAIYQGVRLHWGSRCGTRRHRGSGEATCPPAL